jgi:HK97 gp10 family phage protein
MQVSLKFSGGPALERALKALGGQIAGKLGQNATMAGARVIAAEARAKVPVVSGALKKSIVVRGDQDLRRSGGSQRAAFVVARAFYAHLVEFGTVHSAAKPFMRPALDESGQEAADKMGSNLGAGIEREAERLRR